LLDPLAPPQTILAVPHPSPYRSPAFLNRSDSEGNCSFTVRTTSLASTIVSEFLAHPSCSYLKLVGGSPRRRLSLDLRRRLGQADSRSTLCPTGRMFSLAELATGRVLPRRSRILLLPFFPGPSTTTDSFDLTYLLGLSQTTPRHTCSPSLVSVISRFRGGRRGSRVLSSPRTFPG